jgi:hypothetical protein
MLCNISPLPHIPVKKTTKKQEATVLTSSEFTGNKQLKKSKAERGKRKVEQGLPNSSTNKKKKQRLSLQKTAGNPEVDSHSCADVGKTVTKQQGKMTGFDVLSVQDGYMRTAQFMQAIALIAEDKL